MTKVIVVDDHSLIREGLKKLLVGQWDMEVVAECESASELMDKLKRVECDVVVLDINLPGKSGIEVLYDLKTQGPGVKTLVLSMYPEERFATRALKAGAMGYLNKKSASEELVRAIRRISRGGKYVSESLADQLVGELTHDKSATPHELLSDREFQVLMLIGAGKSVQEITDALSVSLSSVNTYRRRILDKMELKTTQELMRYAIKNGLVD
jgi:DNA-binding NarL/FixJ family response regulator